MIYVSINEIESLLLNSSIEFPPTRPGMTPYVEASSRATGRPRGHRGTPGVFFVVFLGDPLDDA